MTNSNRARGDYLERQTVHALRRYGWLVIRAGGSLGPADLVAVRKAHGRPVVLIIQCKITNRARNMPRVDPDERQALWNAAQQSGGRPMIATRYHPGRVALLELLGPQWTQYPLVDEIHVPSGAGKVAGNDLLA